MNIIITVSAWRVITDKPFSSVVLPVSSKAKIIIRSMKKVEYSTLYDLAIEVLK